ncbi:hypothetical protein [Nonomuraea ceibae]|uniref:hypothetical protein n=1 Tax=Nonomuraea ceibae TaxID=1935170 RepID=UPI001C5ECBD5|nr:hypothetical protein [Nonomuraea ceibae]
MARLNDQADWVFLIPGRGGISPLLSAEQDPSISITATHLEQCPFCPPTRLSTEHYDSLIFPNEHPVVSYADISQGQLLTRDNACDRVAGVNDVVIYTPTHNEFLHKCDSGRISRFLQRLRDRHREHFHTNNIEAIFTFLATGHRFGQSQEHPHGQLLGLPFIPRRIAVTTGATRTSCSICHQEELAHKRDTVICESPSFSAYITVAPRVPFEIWISAKQHNISLADIDDEACTELADLVKKSLSATQAAYFNPYIVSFFDVNPTNEHSHLRCEVLAFGRPSGINKHIGAYELGLGIFMNPSDPAQVAANLRAAILLDPS